MSPVEAHCLDSSSMQMALAELPDDQRQVIQLRLEQELSLEEISDITGVGRETVKSRLRYAMDKYGALARKHHLEPEEAAVAAFEVMRTRAARDACDPWAVVTRAVQITCVAEERGQGLLCSTHQARRRKYEDVHDPERMSDRETPLSDYHPSFHVYDHIDDPDTEDESDGTGPQAQELSALPEILGEGVPKLPGMPNEGEATPPMPPVPVLPLMVTVPLW